MSNYKFKVKYNIAGSIITSSFLILYPLLIYVDNERIKFPYFLYYFFILLQVVSTIYLITIKYKVSNNFLFKESIFFTSKIDINKISEIKFREITKKYLLIKDRKFNRKNELEVFYGFNSSIIFTPENIEDFIDKIKLINPNIKSSISKVTDTNTKLKRNVFYSLTACLLVFIFFIVFTTKFFNDEKSLITENGLIDYSYYSTYLIHTRYSSYPKKCVNIEIRNNRNIIKLTEDTVLWNIVLDSNNYFKPIQIKYFFWRKKNNIIYNPSIISINNKVVKSYKNDIQFKILFIISYLILLFILFFDLIQKVIRLNTFNKVNYIENNLNQSV